MTPKARLPEKMDSDHGTSLAAVLPLACGPADRSPLDAARELPKRLIELGFDARLLVGSGSTRTAPRRSVGWVELWRRLTPGRTTLHVVCGSAGVSLLDVVRIRLTRQLGVTVVVHRHACPAKANDRALSGLMASVGRTAVQVVPCNQRRAAVSNNEPARAQSVVVNNSIYVQPTARSPRLGPLQRLAIVGVLDASNGIDLALDLIVSASAAGLHLDLQMHGPMGRRENTTIYRSAQRHLGSQLSHSESLVADEALDGVDLLLYLQRGNGDAQSTIIWEALSRGIPVIAFDEECLRSIVGGAGQLFHPKVSFVSNALRTVQAWAKDPAEFNQLRQSAVERFLKSRRAGEQQLEELVNRQRAGGNDPIEASRP